MERIIFKYFYLERRPQNIHYGAWFIKQPWADRNVFWVLDDINRDIMLAGFTKRFDGDSLDMLLYEMYLDWLMGQNSMIAMKYMYHR